MWNNALRRVFRAQLGPVAKLTRYRIDLATIPEHGHLFAEHGCDKYWEFTLRNVVGCAAALVCDSSVVGADGQFLDTAGVASHELSGSFAIRFQRAFAGLDDSQRKLSIVLYVDGAGVGSTMRLSMKPIMMTLGELRLTARAKENGCQLVG